MSFARERLSEIMAELKARSAVFAPDVPGVHVLRNGDDVDARDKPGDNDGSGASATYPMEFMAGARP